MSTTFQLDKLYFDLKLLEIDYNKGVIDANTYIQREQELNRQIDVIVFSI